MAESGSDFPLVGVCLCSETSVHKGQVIGTVHVLEHLQNLSEFRKELTTSLSETLGGQRRFEFLTSHGWEINESLENVVKLSHVLTQDGKVNIRLTYTKPRFGLAIEGSPDISVGFIFCDLTSTVADLVVEVRKQLPALHSSLSSRKFCFLDRNSWPISREQESLLTVMEVCCDGVLRIRCSICSSSSRKTSMIEYDHSDNPDFPDRQRLSISDSLKIPFQTGAESKSILSPITETDDGNVEHRWPSSDYSELKAPMADITSFEILLSYVHTEASSYALLLKHALEELGYSVFLDIHCIEGGKDWQDVLNESITNCTLFIPLITMQYGQTLWTNREVKLADVLGKVILPVNFNKNWPPKCLAIQFATTQYIPGNLSTPDKEMTQERFTNNDASVLADAIAKQYQKELDAAAAAASTEIVEQEDISDVTMAALSRQSTQILDSDSPLTPLSAGLKVPTGFNLLRRTSGIKSYGSDLPQSIPKQYRISVFESREGKPLVVISCCKTQRAYAQGLITELEKSGYEVWCSCDIDHERDEVKSSSFQKYVDEAGAVIFILSKEFSEDTFCEQQVYYCEQRKRIIPLIYKPHAMPTWMSTLIGTSTFIDCQAKDYMSTLLDRVQAVLNPSQAVNELNKVIGRKMEIAEMCSKLNNQLPKGNHVYISGGTKFFSESGEAICKEIGKELAKDENIVLTTGGFYGVGETVGRSFFEERERMARPHGICHVIAVRDEQDKTNQTRQNSDHTFSAVPYGDTLFFGNSVRQREMLIPRVISICILVEGGPGAAFEAQQFVWNGNQVIPIPMTGGAAGGNFNIPSCIMIRPPSVSESDWSILSDPKASPSEIGLAVARIVKIVNDPELSVLGGTRSRSNTGGKNRMSRPLLSKKLHSHYQRSDTAPDNINNDGDGGDRDTYTKRTLMAVKRTLSERIPEHNIPES